MSAEKIEVQGREIAVITYADEDYISLTDMVGNVEAGTAIMNNWLRNKNTIEFLGIWEEINNRDFNSIEFERIKNQAGFNRFVLSVKQWQEKTRSKGIIAKTGRYGGTYAHKDIAFEFASWVSPRFKLYLIKEFQRLKKEESERFQLGWDFQRALAKVNYSIHTEAIKNNLLPPQVSRVQACVVYASEADVLNVALFGKTAAQWRDAHSGMTGNMRDYATIEQLVVLSNLESINSMLIGQGITQNKRIIQLNAVAIFQIRALTRAGNVKRLELKEPGLEYAVNHF